MGVMLDQTTNKHVSVNAAKRAQTVAGRAKGTNSEVQEKSLLRVWKSSMLASRRDNFILRVSSKANLNHSSYCT